MTMCAAYHVYQKYSNLKEYLFIHWNYKQILQTDNEILKVVVDSFEVCTGPDLARGLPDPARRPGQSGKR